MEQIIDYFGGKSAMADKLGVSPAAVSWWMQNGIPAGKAIEIEKLSRGWFRAKDIVGLRGGVE